MLRLSLVDVLAITLSVAAAYVVRFRNALGLHVSGSGVSYPVAAIMIACLWWITLQTGGSRGRHIVGHGSEEYRRVISSSFWSFGVVAVASYLLDEQLSRGFFLVLLPLGTGALVLGRWLLRRSLHRSRARGAAVTPTIVVGSLLGVRDVVRDLKRNPNAGYRADAIALDGADQVGISSTPELAGLRVIDLRTIRQRVRNMTASAVVVAPGLPRRTVRQLAWDLEDSDARLMFVPSLVDVAGPRLSIHQMQDLSLVRVHLPTYSGWNHVVKRAFDIVFASLALVLLSPVFAAVAVMIKREDGGPVLFRHTRIGLGGRPFVVHKFRTMCADAESRMDELIAANGGRALLFKLKDDPRITKIGKVLRKYSLDELPQFWTVLRGGMSVVGPRPQVEREVAEYTDDTFRRLLIKPGITGLWQVNGRSKLSLEESIRLDLRYVENWSLSGDLAIILRTIRVVLHSSGAY